MHPVLFRIGPFAIRAYGAMLALSFLVGVYLAMYRGRKLSVAPDRLMDLTVYIAVAAIVGARLFYVIPHWEEFSERPTDIFNPFQGGQIGIGGLTLYGGLILAILVSVWYLRRHRMPVWRVGDALAPSIALGVFLTRIGCFLNGCCFGEPSDVPWALVFPPESAAGYAFPDMPLHPTQLYASLYGLVIFGALLLLERLKRFDGFTFWVFVLLYSVARFAVDFVRCYEPSMALPTVGGTSLSVNQGVSVGLFALAWGMLLLLRRRAECGVLNDDGGHDHTSAGGRGEE